MPDHMADHRELFTTNGRLFLNPSNAEGSLGHDCFRPRTGRPHLLRIEHAYDDLNLGKAGFEQGPRKRRMLASSDSAKRFVRFLSQQSAALEHNKPEQRVHNRRSFEHVPVAPPADMSLRDGSRAHAGPRQPSSEPSRPAAHMPAPRHAADSLLSADPVSTNAPEANSLSIAGAIQDEKPIAQGNGVSVSISLTEPVVYLTGFEQQDSSDRSTAILRGSLLLKVSKSAKIKNISMKFKGRAETEWPEGIPPKRSDFKDVYNIIDHTWSFYDCNMGNSEHHGAHSVQPLKGLSTTTRELDGPGVTSSSFDHFRKSSVTTRSSETVRDRRLSLQPNQTWTFGKSDVSAPNPAHKGYRMFTPGDYIYNFELPIDSRYPETINVDLGTVKYELEATVERAGAFRPNLVGSKEVQVVRTPSNDSMEAVEPIAISRDWEDQLHYDIVISGKSFPLGAQVPIAFKLTPLAKVQCHRVKVFITENVQYFTKDKKVHRMEPTRKLQLFEKRADAASTSTYPGSTMRIVSGGGVSYDDRWRAAAGAEDINRDNTSLLGNLEGEHNIGPTEMELSVQLPSCHTMQDKDKSQRIHFDTTYTNIQVNHWIKIVMRLSKTDPDKPNKRRHFEISIDSPFNILSCRATQANTLLPAYSSPDPMSALTSHDQATCGCPGCPRRKRAISNPIPASLAASPRNGSPNSSSLNIANSPLAPPPAAHLADSNALLLRPIHFMRQPSFNPPPWSDDDPPPPMLTPPPEYDSLVHGDPRSGLADYFARLADDIDDSEDGGRWARRMEIPLTPGGRVNRSMDEPRAWAPML